MNKYTWLFLLLTLPYSNFAQKAEPIQRITRVEKDLHYFQEQSELWGAITQKSPANSEAWLNYFTAARYTNMYTRTANKPYDIASIVANAKKAAPNTYEVYFMEAWHLSRKPGYFDLIKKAYALDPDRPDIFGDFVSHYEMNGDQKRMKEFSDKWYRSKDYSPGLAVWNYNMLVGLEKKAILFTNGDNDTYPAWILQQSNGIRKDVKVLNSSLILIKSYRDLLFKEMGCPEFSITMEEAGGRLEMQKAIIDHFINHANRPVYLAISIGRDLRNLMADDLYLEGMVFRFSKAAYDNIAVLRKNYEQHLRLDQFKTPLYEDPAASVLKKANLNYLPCLIKLLEHYREENNTARTVLVKEQIRAVATAGGRAEQIDSFLK